MNLTRRIVLSLLFSSLVFTLRPSPASAQSQAAPATHDGQHDFDFHFGTWHTHIRRLVDPLTGSNNWVELDGIVTVRKIWDGSANMEELEASNATSHFKGMTLFLYNPQAHQWSQSFASIDSGTLESPLVGEFKKGRGELYAQETYNGRTILDRFVWFNITPDSHSVEESYSADGGKTWETNFIANLTRIKE